MALSKAFYYLKKVWRAFLRPDFSKEAQKTHFSKSYKALFSPGRSIIFAKSAKIPFFISFAMQIDTKSDFSHYLHCKLIGKRFFNEFAMQICQNAIFMSFLQCKFIIKLISQIICNAKRQNKRFIKEFAKCIWRFSFPFAFPSFDFLCAREISAFVLLSNGKKCAVGGNSRAKKRRGLLRVVFLGLDNA